MLSEDFFKLRRQLENELHTHNKIALDVDTSFRVIEVMMEIEERIIAMENCVVKFLPKEEKPEPPPTNIILMSNFRRRRKS